MNDQFIGTWESIDGDCSMRINVSIDPFGMPQIRAYDLSDNEEFNVSNVKITPRTIYFDLVVPSNGYRTQNYLVLQKDGTCEYRITIPEIWVKKTEAKPIPIPPREGGVKSQDSSQRGHQRSP